MRHIMQHEKLGQGKRDNSVGTTPIIVEFDKRGLRIELFDDSADLTAREILRRTIDE